MGQTLFDALQGLMEAVDRGGNIPLKAIQNARSCLTCGYCTEPINIYRENNQIYTRFGGCGHMFHADPDHMRSNTACYRSYIEAKRKDPNNSCIHCRKQSLKRQHNHADGGDRDVRRREERRQIALTEKSQSTASSLKDEDGEL